MSVASPWHACVLEGRGRLRLPGGSAWIGRGIDAGGQMPAAMPSLPVPSTAVPSLQCVIDGRSCSCRRNKGEPRRRWLVPTSDRILDASARRSFRFPRTSAYLLPSTSKYDVVASARAVRLAFGLIPC